MITEVISSPDLSSVSISGVSPGRRCISATARDRVAPSAVRVSILASKAARATAMSDGFVAMQASLVPKMALLRFKPPKAAHPEPGRRLLQGFAVS